LSISTDWIVGFTDGEGCFKFNIMKNNCTIGFEVNPVYEIALHHDDSETLKKIKNVLQMGSVLHRDREALRRRGIAASDTTVYSVTGLRNCLKIKEFFIKHPLQSKKQNDFALWSQCIDMIQSGRHKTIQGFLEIVRIRDRMNIAGKARMINSGRYRNYEWFRSRLIGSTKTFHEFPTE